jgi:hypothetical protein
MRTGLGRLKMVSGKGTAVRIWLIVSFIAIFVLSTFYDLLSDSVNPSIIALNYFILMIMIADIVAVFVLSIVHLRKYREKGFAITSLVISGLLLLFYLVAFFTGFIIGMMELV